MEIPMAAIVLSAVAQPTVWHDVPSVTLSDETLRQRKARVLAQMRQHGYDTLIVYADKEHGGNFEYLTGFIPVLKKPCWYCIAKGRRCWCWAMKTSSWRPLPGWKTG
jgi:creatinine amidohydrolase/Fe(II)-dependent formamide hydrolase-like protein